MENEEQFPFGSIPPPPEAPPDTPSAPDAVGPAAAGGSDVPPPPAPIEMQQEGAVSPAAVLLPAPSHQTLGTEWMFGEPGPAAVRLPTPRKSVALALVVVLVAAVGAFFLLNRSKSGGGTAFALSFAKGQSYRYHMDMSFSGSIIVGGQQQPVTMQIGETFSWNVESVDSKGVATVKMTVEDLTATLNGQSQPGGAPVSVEIQVAKDGRILTAGNLAIAGSSSTAQAFPGMDQFLPLLPDHRVSPGDEWDKAFDQEFPFGGGKIHYVSHNTYLRNETVDGKQSAVIQSSVSLPIDLTIDPAEVSKALGESADADIPKGAKILFTGSENLTMSSWLDLSAHSMLKASVGGTMEIGVELKGVPASAQLPGGKVSFSGRIGLQIQNLSTAPSQALPEAGATTADKKAQSDLRSALAAAKVYFVDTSSYVGISPKRLGAIEPSLTYSTSLDASKGKVSIRNASQTSVLLVTRSASGHVFCIADDVNKGTSYGSQDAKKAADCRGGW